MKKNKRRSQADLNVSAELRLAVLTRDSWRCQNCGSMQQLEVHHQLFRSRGGKDVEENVLTLCHRCHSAMHKPMK